MKFTTALIPGLFKKRYKRFFADILLDDKIVVSHVANTGSMKNCLAENWPVLLSYHPSPTRKLAYSLEMIHNGQSFIGVNTSLTNKLAIEAIKNGTITELQGYLDILPEVKTGNSRIDLLLSNGEKDFCYVEIKNVTLIDHQSHCLFPDAVTTRGQKHLLELLSLKENGFRAVILFIVQREDCTSFKIQNDIDPTYCQLLQEVIKKGVEILVYQCALSPLEIKVYKKLEIGV